MNRSRTLATTAAMSAALFLAAACSSTSSPSATSTSSAPPATSTAPSTTGAAVLTLNGGILTGPGGFTLYRFDHDTATTSACTGGCSALWPPVTGTPSAGSGVTAADLGTITRADGTTQATYQGHPVYRYMLDTAAGQTHGDGVGGVWHVERVTTGQSTAPSTGGGNGY